MANRIYHAFWLLFLYIVWLFLLSVRTERPTDSYHTFLELTSPGSIVHFDHQEARKGVLSFSCSLPGDRVELPFLAVSGQKPSRVLADGREIPYSTKTCSSNRSAGKSDGSYSGLSKSSLYQGRNWKIYFLQYAVS